MNIIKTGDDHKAGSKIQNINERTNKEIRSQQDVRLGLKKGTKTLTEGGRRGNIEGQRNTLEVK